MKDDTIEKVGKAKRNLLEGRKISTEPKDGYMKPAGRGPMLDAETRPVGKGKGKYLQ